LPFELKRIACNLILATYGLFERVALELRSYICVSESPRVMAAGPEPHCH